MALSRLAKLAALFVAYQLARRLWVAAHWRSFKDNVVLITGAGSGIGRLLSLRFAKEGAKLVLWDINEKSVRDVAEEIERAGGTAKAYVADVSNRTAIYSLAEKVLSDFGKVDVLVNNAGIVSGKKFFDVDDASIERTMNINVNAHFWTARAFVPGMLKRNHGLVITIASAAGILGVAGLNEYCASKFGAFGFAESLRFELQKGGYTGVKSLAVCPFYINTGMFDGVQARWPMRILDANWVVKQIMYAAHAGDEILILPRTVRIVYLGRFFLPTWAFDWFSNIAGINQSMDSFRGRKAIA